MSLTTRDIITQLLTFVSSAAHYAGSLLAGILNHLLPKIQVPADLVDPLGYLIVLTAFLVLVQVARKVATIIVIAGWVLMLVRIVMLYGEQGSR